MKEYRTPELTVLVFETDDVITTSQVAVTPPPVLEDDQF